MSILLADIDATCSSLGYHDGSKYYIEDDALQSLKHLIWILRRDNLDSHEYRRYIGHKKVVQTDLLPMLVNYCSSPELSDVLLRLLVNLTNPALLFFRSELPKDHAGRRTYLDLVEISHTYKQAFAISSDIWSTLATRLQKIMEVDVGLRLEEQNLVLERILVLIRNVLQVPANPQFEKRVDNDISVHDQILWALHESGMLELILYILSSEYENQYYLHALEITFLVFREQNVETLANSSVQRSAEEKHADEQALITARRLEAAKKLQNLPPSRHSRFGGTYVYRNVKSISDRDLICHKPLVRILENDLTGDKKKVKANFRMLKDEDKYERQSAFCIRLFLREFCIEILTSAFNNLVRQVRRLLERKHVNNEGSGHDQSYLLWAIRFFLEFNRLNGFKLDLVSEALSTGCIHWICNQIQTYAEMIQTDKKKKLNWNRRLQLGLQAYREILQSLQVMEKLDDDDIKALVAKLKSNIFYVVEYREIILQLLLSYNENHFTRMFVRDLIDTTNVYLKMMEAYCKGSILVQSRTKKKKTSVKKPKTKTPKVQKKKEEKKKLSKEEIMEKFENDWDSKISSNISVVLGNEINLPEEEHPQISIHAEDDEGPTIDEIRATCIERIHMYLRNEDFERAVLLMRSGRSHWPDAEAKFGAKDAQPEEELMLLKEIYLTADLCEGASKDDENDFWKEFDGSDNSDVGEEDNENGDESEQDEDNDDDEMDEEDEEMTEMKEVVMNFADIEKRLLNPKVVRACTWALQSWERMSYREIKSIVTILHRIAMNLNFPIMLMQAQLFRIFQQVFNVPRDTRYEEIRRLGIFIVRRFVELVPKNPKVFAELLFFKSHRECFEIEHGYEGAYVPGYDKGKSSKIWTEEQEEELRRLYMQNQESPQTDQDVIDWIVESLAEKSRTRRAVIKKLKELGLIFKAPTKKSSAAAANRNLFIKEEDDKLRELYDEHRLNEDCLKKIMETFDKKRTKKAVVNRMVQLGLIADEFEIMPMTKGRERERENYASSSEDDYFDENGPREARYERKSTNLSTSNYRLNNHEVSSFRIELEEALKEDIEWIIEALNEAAEDFEEASDELTDAIPLVPVSQSQTLALDNPQFQGLLRSINLLEPHDGESYWKIPANMMPHELRKRAQMLAGEEVGSDEVAGKSNFVAPESDNDDDDDDSDLFSRLRAQREALIYNNSDDNEESQLQPSKKAEKKKKKKPELVASDSDGDEQEMVIKRKKKKKTQEDDVPNQLSEDFVINTQELKQRLAELQSSDEEVVENSPKKQSRTILESSDEEEMPTAKRRVSEKRERTSSNENEMNASNNQMRKIRRIIDSDDE